MARTVLWLGAFSLGEPSRATAIDAFIEGIADGRAFPATLAETLLQIVSGGWTKLNRLVESLHQVTRTSVLAECVVAEILDRLIASWQEPPRDAYHVLALEIELLSNLRQAVSPEARKVLLDIKGSDKAAKLAKQLCRLEATANSAPMREAILEAAEGRLTRAERMSRFAEKGR